MLYCGIICRPRVVCYPDTILIYGLAPRPAILREICLGKPDLMHEAESAQQSLQLCSQFSQWQT